VSLATDVARGSERRAGGGGERGASATETETERESVRWTTHLVRLHDQDPSRLGHHVRNGRGDHAQHARELVFARVGLGGITSRFVREDGIEERVLATSTSAFTCEITALECHRRARRGTGNELSRSNILRVVLLTEGARQTFSDHSNTSCRLCHGAVPSHLRISGLAWIPFHSSSAWSEG
jgi:hypothetical protein